MTADIAAWFAEKGFTIRAYEEDGRCWADLKSTRSDVTVPRYGVGDSPEEALERARRRWLEEQGS